MAYLMRGVRQMNLDIHPLTPDRVNDYLHFFDIVTDVTELPPCAAFPKLPNSYVDFSQ